MKTLKDQDYTINICRNIVEWAKEFYGMSEDEELANEDELSSECMGFASIDEKIIWIFVPDNYSIKDLKETIAHEIGHIIEAGYQTNPEQVDENDELHEAKAEHYMNFYILVDKIVNDVMSACSQKIDKTDVRNNDYDKAIKYAQSTYVNDSKGLPAMLLGDVAELIKITTGKEVDWNILEYYRERN